MEAADGVRKIGDVRTASCCSVSGFSKRGTLNWMARIRISSGTAAILSGGFIVFSLQSHLTQMPGWHSDQATAASASTASIHHPEVKSLCLTN
jgi:hypothetical protein